MVCKCKDPEGQPSMRCLGTCVEREMVRQSQEAQERDPLNGFSEMILAQVEKRIEIQMARLRVEFNRDQWDLYRRAFMEGLKEGIEISKNEDVF